MAIDAKDKTGGTPPHNAAKAGHKEVGEILIAGGADVNAKDEQGRTPLHWAAQTPLVDSISGFLWGKNRFLKGALSFWNSSYYSGALEQSK